MKQFIIFWSFLLYSALACCQQKGATVTVDIDPIKADVMWGRDPDNVLIKATSGKDGKYVFHFTESLPGMVGIGIDAPIKGSLELYLENGDNLSVRTDFEKPAAFSGKGAKNNQVWNACELRFKEGYEKLDARTSSYEQILDQATGLMQQWLDTIVANKAALSPAFYNEQVVALHYKKIAAAQTYAYIFTITTDATIRKKLSETLTDRFWAIANNVQLDDKLLVYKDYKNFMAYNYPRILRWRELQRTGRLDDTVASRGDIALQTYRLIEHHYTGKLRVVAMQAQLEQMLDNAKDVYTLRPLLDEFISKYATSEETTALNDKYKAMTALAAGQEPTYFAIKDINGKDVTLKDFAGKVVYIDFWASWCGPCRAEMKNGAPKLHEQFKDNKDVVFLYISIDDSEEKWRKAIDDDKIEGIHLLSPGGMKSVVAKAFNVSGVPRYVLIGRDGKILDNDATRPSQPVTVQKINEALEKS